MRAALALLAAAALSGAAAGFVIVPGRAGRPATARVRGGPSSAAEPSAATMTRARRPAVFSSATSGSATETEVANEASTEPISGPPSEIPSDWQSEVLSALSVIVDPDLNADIVSLGFIQNLRVEGEGEAQTVALDLELTTPACPVKDLFVQQCQDAIGALGWTRGVADVTLTARPAPAAPAPGTPLGMSRIGAVIAVSSCKGGVGKSTTSVNLAFALEGLGARVGIFDADVFGPSLPTMVTPDDDDVRFVGRQIAPLRRGDVRLMSFGYVNEGSAVMRGPMVSQLLDQFLSLTDWGELDYLVLDMPPGTGDVQLTLTQRLNIDAAVIVTTPQELSFVDVERGVEMFDTVDVPCVAVVENMAYLEKGEGRGTPEIDESALKDQFLEALLKDGTVGDALAAEEVAGDLVKIVQDNVRAKKAELEGEGERIFGPGHKRRLSEQWGIEHTYSVPLMGKIAKNGDSGTPFILDHPDSAQAEVYRGLARSVVSEVAKAKFSKAGGGGRPQVVYDAERHIIQVIQGEGDERNESTISTAALRRACRCAECVEELTGKQLLDPLSIPESVKPLSMSPTGNYALSVDWSDGHRSLYPYRQIRSLLELEEVASAQ